MIKKFLLTVFFIFSIVGLLFAGNPFQYPLFQVIDADGNPVSGGLVYTYVAGTTTNKIAYTDEALTVPATNPIQLDSKGEATFYLSGVYKINVETAANTQVDGFPIDNVSGSSGPIGIVYSSSYGCDLVAAVADIGSVNKTTLDNSGCNCIIPDSTTLTVTDNISFYVPNGSDVTGVSGGGTENLIVLGPYIAGQYQTIGSDLNVTFGNYGSLKPPQIEYAFPEWWGINGTDDYEQVQLAMDSFDTTYGGFVKITRNVFLYTDIDELTIPTTVTLIDESIPNSPSYIIGNGAATFRIMGPGDPTPGLLKPALILHNMGDDGRRTPAIVSRFSSDPESPFNVWDIEFGEYGAIWTNGQTHNYQIVGAQGVSYNAGTASVTNSSATVTGAGTTWASTMVGGEFYIESQEYSGTIKSVESTTSLTLHSTWGGATASGESYYLQGGQAAYRTWYTLGQNGVHIFNRTGLTSVPENYDPITVGENFITINIGGHALKNGNFSPTTIIRMENALNSGGQIGYQFVAEGVTGDPQKWLLMDKLTGVLSIAETRGGDFQWKVDELGSTSRRDAILYKNVGASSGTVVPDLSDGSLIEYSLTDNLIIDNPVAADVLAGQEITFILNQAAAGSKTVTFDSLYKLAGGAFTLTTTGNARDIIVFRAVGTSLFVEISRSQDVK